MPRMRPTFLPAFRRAYRAIPEAGHRSNWRTHSPWPFFPRQAPRRFAPCLSEAARCLARLASPTGPGQSFPPGRWSPEPPQSRAGPSWPGVVSSRLQLRPLELVISHAARSARQIAPTLRTSRPPPPCSSRRPARPGQHPVDATEPPLAGHEHDPSLALSCLPPPAHDARRCRLEALWATYRQRSPPKPHPAGRNSPQEHSRIFCFFQPRNRHPPWRYLPGPLPPYPAVRGSNRVRADLDFFFRVRSRSADDSLARRRRPQADQRWRVAWREQRPRSSLRPSTGGRRFLGLHDTRTPRVASGCHGNRFGRRFRSVGPPFAGAVIWKSRASVSNCERAPESEQSERASSSWQRCPGFSGRQQRHYWQPG